MHYSEKNFISSRRAKVGLSQTELGFLCDHKTGTNISKNERGLRFPGLEESLALEIILETPLQELYRNMVDRLRKDLSRRAKTLLECLGEEASPEFARKVETLSKLARPDDETIVRLWQDEC